MSESDLAEVLGAFNEVTAKLHASHETLRGEVARLQSELREANEQVARSKRLAALGEMAAGIAHEIRNPLGSIRLYAKMLEDDLAAGAPGEPRQLAVKIGGAVRTVDAVVRDVLAFAREMRVTLEEVDAGELITAVVDEVVAARRADGLEIPRLVRLDSRETGCAFAFACDSTLARRAIANVVSNAVEAMAERRARSGGPEMTLTTSLRQVQGGRRNEWDGQDKDFVSIVIEDNGPGVSEEVMERMFNPFFTTRATGTGLGLAIVHRIMDAHGGGVRVWNRQDADGSVTGAVVELMFPVRAASTALHEQSGESRQRGKGLEARTAKGAARRGRVRENAA